MRARRYLNHARSSTRLPIADEQPRCRFNMDVPRNLIGGLAAKAVRVPVVWGLRCSGLPADSTRIATRMVVRACAGCIAPRSGGHCLLLAARAPVHEAMGYPAGKFRMVPNGFIGSIQAGPGGALVGARRVGNCRQDCAARGADRSASTRARTTRDFSRPLPQSLVRLPGRALPAGRRNGVDLPMRSSSPKYSASGSIGKVHLFGLREDMPRLMASLDVVASASWTEAFPNVLGEAMACGVPCVVTDAGDSAYVVGDTGTVVPPGDMAGLADGIFRTLTLPATERRTLGERARARVAEQTSRSVRSRASTSACSVRSPRVKSDGSCGRCSRRQAIRVRRELVAFPQHTGRRPDRAFRTSVAEDARSGQSRRRDLPGRRFR